MFLPPFLEVRLPRVVVDVALVLSPLNIRTEFFLNLDKSNFRLGVPLGLVALFPTGVTAGQIAPWNTRFVSDSISTL